MHRGTIKRIQGELAGTPKVRHTCSNPGEGGHK